MAEGGQLVEPENSIGMDDADVENVADFRAAEEPPASAMSDCSDGRRAGSSGQPCRDAITGA
eukprot:1096942-Alexandrium_andersonii.AAC.1